MKSSIHLFYGIIIGVLATLCMGLNKEEAKEFKVEEIISLGHSAARTANDKLAALKKEGWTIIEVDIMENVLFYAHVGK